MNVLVTGATGLVGFETAERLSEASDAEVVGVCRHPVPGSSAIAWDMAAAPPPGALRRRWDVIVHTAADTRWTLPHDEAFQANVATVEALDPLVSAATRVVHVSTAYATGIRGGGTSSSRTDYRNSYEWAKAHAERVAQSRGWQLTIVRPPLVIGRRADGRAARFAGMYTILRGLASSVVPAIVANPDAQLDVIPVDDLAALIVDVVERGEVGERLTIATGADAPRVAEVVSLLTNVLNEWREERGVEPLRLPPLVSPDSWNRFFLPFARAHLSDRHLRIIELLGNFEPYLSAVDTLEPTHPVRDVTEAIRASVRYWADAHTRVASQRVRAWKAKVASVA